MKYRSNVPKYSEFLFEVIDPEFYNRAKKIRDSGKHNIIIAGLSYGQGSSREHAALCPMYMGVKAVVAQSFEMLPMELQDKIKKQIRQRKGLDKVE